MRLSKMFKNAPTINVEGLSRDSRQIKPGDLYFCLSGMRFDGHDFIDQALEKGAIGIVHSKPIEDKKPGAVYIRVPDVQEALNQAASIYFGRPSQKMKMIGITGTNGKTSTAKIYQHLVNENLPCGYIGTIAISYGNVNLMPDLTTPDTLMLHKTLKDMFQAKMEACVLEVSSHGLAQKRVNGIDFDLVLFTNFTHDHLDFHGSMEQYFDAKALLFSQRVKEDGIAILNVDDPMYSRLRNLARSAIITYGIDHKADYQAVDIHYDNGFTQFTLLHDHKKNVIRTNLSGKVNVYNLLAAICAALQSGISMEEIIERCKNIPQIPGRLERISLGQPFEVVVDFAHTPDGMEKIMEYGKLLCSPKGKLIAVFGSAGQRDIAKRKTFGEIADKYCKEIILTEDDPRDEDPREIANQIQTGIEKAKTLFIQDRYEAIRQAVEKAGEGDTVLILGKGDEPFMYRENGREPWIGDDQAARESIERIMAEKNGY